MGEAERNKRQSAREQIAAQQAAARRAESRRRMLIAGGSIVVVLAVVLVFIVIRLNSSTPAASSTPVTGTALPASVSDNVTDVPVSTLDAVGPGSILKQVSKPVTAITGAPLTQGGKPELLYIGAEYCPYCAAMRWAMATALSRFGTLSPLRGIHSSPTDVYPSTATLTFYKSGLGYSADRTYPGLTQVRMLSMAAPLVGGPCSAGAPLSRAVRVAPPSAAG